MVMVRPLRRKVPQKTTGVVRAGVRAPQQPPSRPTRTIAAQKVTRPRNNVTRNPIVRTNEILGIPNMIQSEPEDEPENFITDIESEQDDDYDDEQEDDY